MQRYVWPAAAIAQLWSFYDSWFATGDPCYMRHALRCKAQALINEDRIFDNQQG